MTKTVSTATSSYLSAAEAIKRGDWRIFGDLCSDDGTRIALADLPTHANFLALLRDASGMVEQACQVGGRYSVEDLQALAADSGVGAGALSRLIYRLLVVLAYERKPTQEMKTPWIYDQAMTDLQALRDGERIFPFVETQEAGRPEIQKETAAVVEAREGIVVQAERYFGRRNNRRYE